MNVRFGFLLLAGLCCAGAAGCGGGEEIIALQGATFPAPLYKRWFLEYYRRHPEVRTNYTPIGSGAGIRQFTAGLIDFGASDAGMSAAEIKKLPETFGGVRLLPLTAGTIVLSYNLPDVGSGLKLSRKAYLGVFAQEITHWNDPEIVRHNPNVRLPDREISVVTRADSSGTTYAFTNHLSAVGRALKTEWGPGVDKSVKWPASIAAQGNDGVAALIQLTPGAIGYLEYGYAELARLNMADLENHAGRFMAPTPENGRKALEGAVIPDDLQIKIPDPHHNPEAYPIVTYTWLLCRARYSSDRVETIKDLVAYCLGEGQQISAELGYLPLPEEVIERTKQALAGIHADSPVASGKP